MDGSLLRRNSAGRFQICRRLSQPAGFVLIVPQTGIAFATQQTADLAGRVTMIDGERLLEYLLADGTSPVLLGQHPAVVLHREAYAFRRHDSLEHAHLRARNSASDRHLSR